MLYSHKESLYQYTHTHTGTSIPDQLGLSIQPITYISLPAGRR